MTDQSRRNFLKGVAGASAVVTIRPELLSATPRLSAPVSLGIVGCGRQARAILGELAKFEDVTVAALCDVDEARLRSSLRRAPAATVFEDHAKMLDQTQNLDAVIVATPSHLHRQPATDALAAGQHVYCEGPLATSIEDCRAIALAARESDKVFQTGMQGRSDPVYTLARNFYRSGSIRDLVEMHAQYRRKTSWRAASNRHDWKLDPAVSMGLIGEFGTHQFDVMHWYTGKYPTHVRARGAVLAYPDGREVADTVSAELTFPGGITMTYQATLANSYEGQYELLVGTMGAIKLGWTHGWLFKEADAPTQGWEVYANRQTFHNDEGITLIANATQLADQGKLQDGVGLEHPPLYYALESFLKSITEQTPVACTAEEGLRAAAVSIQTVRALRTGEEVGIDESLFQTNR